MKNKFLAFFLSFLLTACSTTLSKEVLDNADYGKKPNNGHHNLIKKHFALSLIDPTSPIYAFRKPIKGYSSNGKIFGWMVCGYVNAKNRFGGYTGSIPFSTLIRNGKIINGTLGQSQIVAGDYAALFRNDYIKNACQM